MRKITLRQQYITVKGRKYGPYWYEEWRENGKVRTRYVGKTRPATPTSSPATPAYNLYDGPARVRECWLLLGYDPTSPPADAAIVRKRVFNLCAAKQRTQEVKQEIRSAWSHLQSVGWPGRRSGEHHKGEKQQ